MLDVDSTLTGIEGIDWLAERRGPDLAAEIGELTRQAYQPKEPEPQHQPAPAPVQHQQVATRQPPMLPEGNLAQQAESAVDDAAAQLLRPMLRQWLQENMPKIVEKALLSEAQGDSSPKPRK